MIILRNMTIKYKLMLILMLACTIGLILAGGAFIGIEYRVISDNMIQDLLTRSAMTAENCKAALAFQDSKDAERVLQTLHVDHSVVFAGVYDKKNNLFAAYYRDNSNKIAVPPLDFNKTVYKFSNRSLIVTSPIILDGSITGSVCLQSDLELIYATLRYIVVIITVVIFISLAIVFLVSIRLQKVISHPILSLTQLAKTISEKKDYSARAIKQSSDEVGLLIDAFNEMLEQIQKRDSELLFAKEGLEVKVKERTAELSKANEQMTREIAERKNAQIKLYESEEKYRLIFDKANDGIFLMQNDKFIDCNNRTLELFGCTREQIIGNQPYLFSPPRQPDGRDSKEKALEKINAALAGQQQPFEWVHTKSDGTTFYAEVMLNTFMMKEEPYILAVVRDISKRKEAEETMKKLNLELGETVAELEETNKEMKNFVYIASHDLREPLRKVTAFGSMLQKSLQEKISGDDLENLRFMIDGATRMTKMIEGLLVYSRVSTQAQPAHTVDLNEIVTQLQQLELAVLIEEKQVTMEIPQPLPCVEVDPVQIRQLMQNLIANGIKYQKKENTPCITITSKPAADGMIRIDITDNGIGIMPEYQGAIFSMFKRLHTRSEYEGTGIGLAVCKKIVERHGGKIGVESQPDKGSTFWFTVPAAQKTAVAAAESKDYV